MKQFVICCPNGYIKSVVVHWTYCTLSNHHFTSLTTWLAYHCSCNLVLKRIFPIHRTFRKHTIFTINLYETRNIKNPEHLSWYMLILMTYAYTQIYQFIILSNNIQVIISQVGNSDGTSMFESLCVASQVFMLCNLLTAHSSESLTNSSLYMMHICAYLRQVCHPFSIWLHTFEEQPWLLNLKCWHRLLLIS